MLHFILQQTCLSSEDRELVAAMIRYLDDHLILGLGLVETNKLLDNLLAMMAILGTESLSRISRPSEPPKKSNLSGVC